ncbi:MAG: DUF1835 domain-containing protein [Bacteroidota bacterium]|nr:DUF1835 domain-containing protein [Bacteroidota bacterium]
MIHVVFQHADGSALKKSFDLDETLTGKIIEIKDDLAVGPIENIFSEMGIEARKQWWREVLTGGDLDGKVDSGEIDDAKTVLELTEKLNNEPGEIVWIWAAPNKHDVSGYYWLMSQLKDFQGRIFILYLHNLPFINEKGQLFYPENIFEIPAKEFIKAKKLARPITTSEFEVDPDEWIKLCNENKGIRILEGGKKLIHHEYDYYDAELLKFITVDWQKVNKLLHSFYSKSKNTTGDAYLLWRLKLMIAAGKIDAQGEIKGIKDFEVKLKSSSNSEKEISEEM